MGEVELPLPNLLGDFQISNVSTAIVAARKLNQFKITESQIRKAITKIRSEGRLQNITQRRIRKYVSKQNHIVIDGAHNILAAYEIKKYLYSHFYKKKKIFMVLGMMKNKEHKKFIGIFKDIVDCLIALDIPNQENFFEKEKLLKIARSCGIKSKTENSIKNALMNISKKNPDAVIFCTGSLYFCGEILNIN